MKGQERFAMSRTIPTIAAALGLALATFSMLISGAFAQDDGSLILSVFDCPEGYEDDNYAADCTTPAEGVEFTIATPNTGNTETTAVRGDGLATFSLALYDLDPNALDTVSVGEPATQTSDYAVFCTLGGDGELDFSYETIDFEPGGPLLGIAFDFDTGDDVACEWYRLRLTMPGDDDDDTGDVGELPNTGIGDSSTAAADQTPLLASFAVLSALAGAAVFTLRRRPTA
jgi:hypothetical protein